MVFIDFIISSIDSGQIANSNTGHASAATPGASHQIADPTITRPAKAFLLMHIPKTFTAPSELLAPSGFRNGDCYRHVVRRACYRPVRRTAGSGQVVSLLADSTRPKRRSRRELVTTLTDENAMAAPAIIGLRRPMAARGIAAVL